MGKKMNNMFGGSSGELKFKINKENIIVQKNCNDNNGEFGPSSWKNEEQRKELKKIICTIFKQNSLFIEKWCKDENIDDIQREELNNFITELCENLYERLQEVRNVDFLLTYLKDLLKDNNNLVNFYKNLLITNSQSTETNIHNESIT